MKEEKIYFNPDEVQIIAMALGVIMEDLSSVNQGRFADIPWTPEARKFKKEMMKAARSAAAKLEKFTGMKCDLPPYNPGDENEFLTKES